jgi:hypothetical protein
MRWDPAAWLRTNPFSVNDEDNARLMAVANELDRLRNLVITLEDEMARRRLEEWRRV